MNPADVGRPYATVYPTSAPEAGAGIATAAGSKEAGRPHVAAVTASVGLAWNSNGV